MSQLQLKIETYTYADYLTWNDNKRWEIIDGIPYDMSPAPRSKHQRISGAIFNEFYNFLKGKKCEIYSAPFDVRLPDFENSSDEDIDTVVQPDLSVFCDPSKIDEKGAIGAPDLIIEILSESTSKNDLYIKLHLYQKHKVKEYWIVDPDEEILYVHILDKNNRYSNIQQYKDKGFVKVHILPKLKIKIADIFYG